MLDEQANLAALERLAQDGIAAIEQGDFTVVRGREGSRQLAERWNARAAKETAARVKAAKSRLG